MNPIALALAIIPIIIVLIVVLAFVFYAALNVGYQIPLFFGFIIWVGWGISYLRKHTNILGT